MTSSPAEKGDATTGPSEPGSHRRRWWSAAVATAAALAAVGLVVVVWQLGWLESDPGTAQVVWQEQVTEPGIPGASRLPTTAAEVSGDTVAVWIGSEVLLLNRTTGQIGGRIESFGPPVLLDGHVAVHGQGGLGIYDSETQELVQELGSVRAVGGAGSLLVFHAPPEFLMALDVHPEGRRRFAWQADIPAEEGNAAVPPVVIPTAGQSDGMVVAAVDRHVFRFAVSDGRRVWSTGVDGPSAIRDLVVAADIGMVYVADGNQNITALDLTDGTRRWSLQGIHRPPSVDGGVLVTQLSDGRIATFDARTAERSWTVPGDSSSPAPVVSDGEVVMADGIDLVARDVADGTERWRLQLLGPPAGISVDPDGTVFAVVSPGIVYAVESGAVVWRTIGANLARVRAQPTISAGDGVLIATEPSDVWQALDAASGRQLWTYEPDSRLPSPPPAVSNAGMFFIDGDDLVALEPQSGQERWRVTPGFISGAEAAPATAGDTVVAGIGPALLAVDAATGDERWRHTFGSGTPAVAATVDAGAVYATTADRGVLARLDLATGEVDWQREPGPTFIGPPVVAGDTVVVGGEEGTLRGFDASTGQATWRADFTVDALGSQPDGSHLFVLRDEHTVAAIDTSDGSHAWTFEADDQVLLTLPVPLDGTIITAGSDGTVYGIDRHGTERWQLELGSPVLATPSITGWAAVRVSGRRQDHRPRVRPWCLLTPLTQRRQSRRNVVRSQTPTSQESSSS